MLRCWEKSKIQSPWINKDVMFTDIDLCEIWHSQIPGTWYWMLCQGHHQSVRSWCESWTENISESLTDDCTKWFKSPNHIFYIELNSIEIEKGFKAFHFHFSASTSPVQDGVLRLKNERSHKCGRKFSPESDSKSMINTD